MSSDEEKGSKGSHEISNSNSFDNSFMNPVSSGGTHSLYNFHTPLIPQLPSPKNSNNYKSPKNSIVNK